MQLLARHHTALCWARALGCVLALGACAEPVVAPSGAVSLVTDASTYVALRDVSRPGSDRYTLEMIVAVVNETGGEVTLQGCATEGNTPRFAVSMAATNSDWSPAYENISACQSPSTITLAVGESRADRIELTAPRLSNAETGEALGELEGRMRLVYYVDGVNLWSNAFDVRIERVIR